MLLVVQVFLVLSERFRWLPFNEKKGWTVLVAVGVVIGAVLAILIWGLVCLCLRRRFQFSFRSLLVFLMALIVPLGWFAWELERARKQGEAVEGIVEAHGFFLYDYQMDEVGLEIQGAEPPAPSWLRKLIGEGFFCDVVAIECTDTAFGNDDVKHLQGLKNVEQIMFTDTQITDDGLGHLRDMRRLKWLVVADTHITDNGLEHVKGMTGLRELGLSRTQITDNGLEYLKNMTNLERLSLDSTEITDNGLARLDGMTKLEKLSLNNTQITDNGLGHLEGMTKLEQLWLLGTKVTDNGIRQVQRVLPNCQIIYHP